MTEDSPFKSPEIVDEVHDSFDQHSQEIFALAKGLRWLEIMCAFYFAGIVGPPMILVEAQEKYPDDISKPMLLPLLSSGWLIASLISGIVVWWVLMSLGLARRHMWMPIVAGIPFFSFAGILFATRLVHLELRGYGLKFDKIGPSQKEIVRQLRHEDGSLVDPKSLGVKR